jgi:uncharacterized protein (DUF433 family)
MQLPNPLVTTGPERLSGAPVFTNTRVPIQNLFDHLAEDLPLSAFLKDFPGVSREHAVAVLDLAMSKAFPASARQRADAAE